MMSTDPNVRDVTPAYLLKREKKRTEESNRQKIVKTRKELEIAEVKKKLGEIEAKITAMRKENAPEKQITAWRQAWDFHNDKLKKLKGK